MHLAVDILLLKKKKKLWQIFCFKLMYFEDMLHDMNEFVSLLC